ncbi:transcriptional regulator, AraC family [Aeromicrobium marinum DSM 15272]|uniref:Transcriptional regulator, AraC family n=1 Tax=Aeromicrobium marinum DSM 15272 TaxID=585531 RepID=E2SD98_9ACTN|nr:AraC family transcriptional regulator [Aeromicrobium marinum]EFQ82475.1 transcriptional regulator, AraC family [Aeromicrobium marinum DSM 15272]
MTHRIPAGPPTGGVPVLGGPTLGVHVIRAAIRWAADSGVDLTVPLTAADLTAAQIADDHGRCTAAQLAAFVRSLWRLSNDEFFGLGNAPVPRGTWSLLCHGLIHAANLNDVLRRADHFLPVLPGLPRVSLVDGGTSTRIELDLSGLDDPEYLLTDLAVMITHRFGAWLTGSTVRLDEVWLPYDRPAEDREYLHLFGTLPRFNAPTTALVVSQDQMNRPVTRTEADLNRYLRNAPVDIFAQRDYETTLTARVRAALSATPVRQWPDASDLASALAYSEPHLRRLLRAEGSSISGLRNDLRRDLSISALLAGRPTDEVAELVGFSETSAFRRAFKRWVGASPGAYRP